MPAGEAIQLHSARGRGALAATIIGSGMVFLDTTIANVAARRIGEDFHTTFASLQWVLNAYALTLASLILFGGALGDRLGRRRIFCLGAVWFAAASLACALAPTVAVLIAARAVQGIGAALMTPGSLAIISTIFRPADRALAVGAWAGTSGVATALGPLLGGWLVQDFSWRWAFAINLPLAAAVVVLAQRFVPETRARHDPRRLDLAGTVLIAAGLGGLTLGTISAGNQGWSAGALTATAGGAALVLAFVVVERRSAHPIVPLRLFGNPTFAATNAMTLLVYAALSAMSFVLVLHPQVAGGYGALAAGLSMLPITAAMILLSPVSGALAARIGPRAQLTTGPLLAATGLILLLRVDAAHHDYLRDVLPGVLVFALGMVSMVAPLTSTVMGAAPRDEVGVASGVNNAISRAGGLLAVAVLPPLAGLQGEAYRRVPVMVHGYRTVLVCCAGLLLAAALVIALTAALRRGSGGDVLADEAGPGQAGQHRDVAEREQQPVHQLRRRDGVAQQVDPGLPVVRRQPRVHAGELRYLVDHLADDRQGQGRGHRGQRHLGQGRDEHA
jgi:EmrB/QacA subfamily drug resistance transporter